jgi:hypothetical protein
MPEILVPENEDGEEMPVTWSSIATLCTLFAGFQIDGSIQKADVLWGNKDDVHLFDLTRRDANVEGRSIIAKNEQHGLKSLRVT